MIIPRQLPDNYDAIVFDTPTRVLLPRYLRGFIACRRWRSCAVSKSRL